MQIQVEGLCTPWRYKSHRFLHRRGQIMAISIVGSVTVHPDTEPHKLMHIYTMTN